MGTTFKKTRWLTPAGLEQFWQSRLEPRTAARLFLQTFVDGNDRLSPKSKDFLRILAHAPIVPVWMNVGGVQEVFDRGVLQDQEIVIKYLPQRESQKELHIYLYP